MKKDQIIKTVSEAIDKQQAVLILPNSWKLHMGLEHLQKMPAITKNRLIWLEM